MYFERTTRPWRHRVPILLCDENNTTFEKMLKSVPTPTFLTFLKLLQSKSTLHTNDTIQTVFRSIKVDYYVSLFRISLTRIIMILHRQSRV
jgi:hypothetical protein